MVKIIPVENIEDISNKVTEITELATNKQYPSAKAVYDALQNVEGGTVDEEYLVGKKTPEGGEIFNDYETNLAGNMGVRLTEAPTLSEDNKKLTFHLPSPTADNRPYTAKLILALQKMYTFTGEFDDINRYVVYRGAYNYILKIDESCKMYIPGSGTNTSNIIYSNDVTDLILEFASDNAIITDVGLKKQQNGEPLTQEQLEATPWYNTLTFIGCTTAGYVMAGGYSHAEGLNTEAYRVATHTEGRNNSVYGDFGHAEGQDNVVGYCSHAEGRNNNTLGEYAHTEGQDNEALGLQPHAEGYYTKATNNPDAQPRDPGVDDGRGTHAEGVGTVSKATASHAEGYSTMASNKGAHSEGLNTRAEGVGAHAEGGTTKAIGGYAHAEGGSSKAEGDYSHAEGDVTNAKAKGAHSEGSYTLAEGDASHAEGFYTYAKGSNSHAEGRGSSTNALDTTRGALGAQSHVEGYLTTASGSNAHAEGSTTKATGANAHSEGNWSNATGITSHAEGEQTNATGKYAHSEGKQTRAGGEASHAEGGNTVASGNYSHAGGRNTVAANTSQTVIGEFNDNKSNTLFEVGNGTGEDVYVEYKGTGPILTEKNRYNAFEVYRAGYATVQTQGTTDKSVVIMQTLKNLIRFGTDEPENVTLPDGCLFYVKVSE